MKKTIRLTEAKLKRIIAEAIENIVSTDFDDIDRYNDEDEFRQNYNFGDDAEYEYDPTAEDPEAYMMSKYYGGDDMDLSDGDLYGY